MKSSYVDEQIVVPVSMAATAPAFRATLFVIAAYVAIGLALLTIADIPGPVVPGLSALFSAGVFVTEISTSFLLLMRFREAPAWSLLLLVCAYLYSGCMAVAYLLTFPGALEPNVAIMGDRASAAWIYIPWVLGFASLTLASSLMETVYPSRYVPMHRLRHAAIAAFAAVCVTAAAIALAATIWVDQLPALIGDTQWTLFDSIASYLATTMLAGSIVLILSSIRGRNELFLWLSVALTAMLFGNLLATASGSRFTVGWTVSRLSWVISGCALFLYFMAQFVRQQRLLIHSRDALEQRVAARTNDLTEMIAQRDLLLREVHHRVKNNFQVVNSLIHLQARHAEADETRDALDDLQRRVYALGLVHKLLMQSSDLATFDTRDFLSDLCANLIDAEHHGRINSEADPIQVDLDFAGSLGLLVTELVMNAFKRRAPANQPSSVMVSLRRGSPYTLVLTVADNVPREANLFAPDSAGTESRVMQALIAQLHGKLHISHEGGTKVTVVLAAHGTHP